MQGRGRGKIFQRISPPFSLRPVTMGYFRVLTRCLRRPVVLLITISVLLFLCLVYPGWTSGHNPVPYRSRDLFSNYPLSTNATRSSCAHAPVHLWPPAKKVLTKLFPPVDKSCSLLWSGNRKEVRRVQDQLSSWKNALLDKHFLSLYLTNCTVIRMEFDNFYTSNVEKEFPIAFLLNIHTSVQQIVRFLKSIYRPQNLYCLHVDLKASFLFHQIVNKLTHCLPNVISATRSYDVMYSTIDQVDALRSCYSELLEMKEWKWKYAINLCGRELPLKTNREIVEILRGMKSANVINPGVLLNNHSDFDLKRRILYRIQRRPVIRYTSEPLGPIPDNIQIYKNNTFIAVTREFVEFLFKSRKVNDLYLFLRDTRYPDEQFFVTVNHFPEAPGNVQQLIQHGLLEHLPQVSASYWLEGTLGFLPHRLQVYFNVTGRCYDKLLAHSVCIASCGDLVNIKGDYQESGVFFFNKYFEEYDHVVMDCMEEELLRRNEAEFLRDCQQSRDG